MDVDPKRISEAFENEKGQLENLRERCNFIKQVFKGEEEFHKKLLGDKIDIERKGKMADDKLDKLFKDSETAKTKIAGKEEPIDLL